MNNNVKLFIEETENSRFVVAGFNSFGELINYQVRMITNNKIKYLLPATLQQMDGNIKLYYDISKKISLRDFISKSYFSQTQFLGILKSLTNIDDELDEFQLVNSGIIYDPNWIFVDRDGENVEYVYIPNAVRQNDASEIRDFLMNLLRGGYIEPNAQVLITNLFALANDANMSLRDLKEFIYRIEGRTGLTSNRAGSQNGYIGADVGIDNNISNSERYYSELRNRPSARASTPVSKPVINSDKKSSKKVNPFSRKPKAPQIEKNSQSSNIPEVTETPQTEEKSTLPRTLFIAGNILILAVLFKLYTMGLFTLANGAIDTTKVLAVAIAIIAIDAIAIKNIFFNSKNKNKAPKEKKEKAQKVKREKTPKPKKEKAFNNKKEKPADLGIPAVPSGANQPVIPPVVPPVSPAPEMYRPAEQPGSFEIPNISKQIKPDIAPKPTEIPRVVEPPKSASPVKSVVMPTAEEKPFSGPVHRENAEESLGMDNTVLMQYGGIEYEETELMVTNEPLGFIERYENNEVVDKYVIKKDRIIIGRLRSQVDMTVLNPKVGKIHAEINYKDNRFYIKDICSKNGTYLGDSDNRIKTDTDFEITDGQEFRLADSRFKLHTINKYGEK